MSNGLDQALQELKALPADTQDAIAQELLDVIRSKRKWDTLFADPSCDGVLNRLAAEARADMAAGKTSATDPADEEVISACAGRLPV